MTPAAADAMRREWITTRERAEAFFRAHPEKSPHSGVRCCGCEDEPAPCESCFVGWADIQNGLLPAAQRQRAAA